VPDGLVEPGSFFKSLWDGTRDGTLFTDDIRCPVHVADLAAALLELASGNDSGIHHVAGPDAVSRHVPCQVHLFAFCGVL
jgi:dTDP-4-dehydrorhamnose reductase